MEWQQAITTPMTMQTERVRLRAAEGDDFFVVFLDSRPGVPVLIYPADGYRLP